MQETLYTIWEWGKRTANQNNIQHEAGIRALAKRSTTNQYELANELLCMRLGHALKLPIPIGGIVVHNQQPYFASLHISIAEQNLPPAVGSALDQILHDGWLTCGIICFDSWILNEDRHRSNISIRKATNEIHLIDHGRAFYEGNGRSFFNSVRNDICIGPDHCLAKKVTGLWQFDEWHQRIKDIPEYFIRESVEQSTRMGLPASDADFCVDFLLDRRERLKDIFRAHRRQAFPQLDHGLFDPFEQEVPEYCI